MTAKRALYFIVAVIVWRIADDLFTSIRRAAPNSSASAGGGAAGGGFGGGGGGGF